MQANVGFLTVLQHDDFGYFGGYLIVNRLARPLEFQCTLPIKPSRAQAVLYGPTLEDFVCGEQIGKALISKAKIKPDLIVTDSVSTLAVSVVTDQPIIMLDRSQSESLKLPTQTKLQTSSFLVGNYQITVPANRIELRNTVEKVLGSLCDSFDLREPFQRIVDALAEANPNAKAA